MVKLEHKSSEIFPRLTIKLLARKGDISMTRHYTLQYSVRSVNTGPKSWNNIPLNIKKSPSAPSTKVTPVLCELSSLDCLAVFASINFKIFKILQIE